MGVSKGVSKGVEGVKCYAMQSVEECNLCNVCNVSEMSRDAEGGKVLRV